MLQCAPYIKNICDNINSHLWAEEEITSEESPFQKKDSKVSLTNVKGFKVTTVEPDVKGAYQIGVDFDNVKDPSNLYKVIRKIRPDSPDVIRAAKRFEQTRSKLNGEKILETIVEQSPELGRKQQPNISYKLGARSKTNRYMNVVLCLLKIYCD